MLLIYDISRKIKEILNFYGNIADLWAVITSWKVGSFWKLKSALYVIEPSWVHFILKNGEERWDWILFLNFTKSSNSAIEPCWVYLILKNGEKRSWIFFSILQNQITLRNLTLYTPRVYLPLPTSHSGTCMQRSV